MSRKSIEDLEYKKFINADTESPIVRTTIQGSSGGAVDVNDSGQMKVVLDGKVCLNNSTSTPLLADGVFEGDSGETLDYALIFVNVYTDVASATDGLEYFTSSDGVTWFAEDAFTIPANSNKTFSFQPNRRYFKLKYTNGGTDQTAFDLQTVFKKTNSKASSHKISDSIISEDDAELVKAVLTGENAAGNFVNFGATNAGNFKTSLEEFESGVSVNSNTQLKVSPYIIDEFGNYGHILGDNIFRGAIITIPPEHHEIHCGDSYVASRVADIGNGATDEILIIVPNEAGTYPDQSQKLYHMVVEGLCEAEGEFELFEAPTVTANGTALSIANRNRNSSLTDYLGIYHTPTTTADGTSLEVFHVGSGKALGGEGRTDEWVLKNNTIYLARFTNFTTSNNHVTWRLNYYVHAGV